MIDTIYPLAIVTGAAHRIGRSIAGVLAQNGFAIGLHYYQSQNEAEHAAVEITTESGAPVYLLHADLTQPDQIKAMFRQAAGLSHPLRVLVNCAAVMTRGNLTSMAVEEWDSVLSLNLRAPWLCSREAAHLMQPDGGSIINISDSGAQKTWTGYPAYVVSKSAVETLTRLLARDLAPAVRVNAVAPGLILPSSSLPSETWEKLVDRLPLRAAGQPEDVARAVLFFIQNPYITGQILAVDGGHQII